MSDNDDEAKTPVRTGSRPRWPIHQGRCLKASEELDEIALKKEKVLWKLDRRGAETCRKLAARCRELAKQFETWEYSDIGLEKRLELINEMYELVRQAKHWGVTL